MTRVIPLACTSILDTPLVCLLWPAQVGVFASRGDALAVLEYSELDPAVASAQNPATGRLMYNWSNICMHYFSVDWLSRVSVQ